MSVVNILNIQVLDNPTRYTNPFQFEITFECTSPLKDDLEWKIIYVGSAEDERYDQVLDCIMVGPVPVGINKFVYQADAPNANLIPPADVIGVTVVLLTCSYRGHEFVRVGYYVNNEYDDEQLRIEPPATPLLEHLTRNILADKPRVTRFPIRWDAVDELEPPPSVFGADGEEAMDEEMGGVNSYMNDGPHEEHVGEDGDEGEEDTDDGDERDGEEEEDDEEEEEEEEENDEDYDDGDHADESASVIAGSSPEHQMIVDSLGASSSGKEAIKATVPTTRNFDSRFLTTTTTRPNA